MSKIMSVFEKLNLVEKVNDETIDTSVQNDAAVETQEDQEVKTSYEEETKVSNNYEIQNKNEKTKETHHNYDNNIDISEIYSLFNVENSDINTVFMLGNFINALPESLPYDVKKSSVISIINASKIDMNNLIADGEKRLSVLNKFADNYYNATKKTVSEYKSEIIKLSDMIDKYKDQIKVKENLLEEQNNIIQYETRKINNILDFFNEK